MTRTGMLTTEHFPRCALGPVQGLSLTQWLSDPEGEKTWHQIPALQLPCSVPWGKSLSLSRPQSPHPALLKPSRLQWIHIPNETRSKQTWKVAPGAMSTDLKCPLEDNDPQFSQVCLPPPPHRGRWAPCTARMGSWNPHGPGPAP